MASSLLRPRPFNSSSSYWFHFLKRFCKMKNQHCIWSYLITRRSLLCFEATKWGTLDFEYQRYHIINIRKRKKEEFMKMVSLPAIPQCLGALLSWGHLQTQIGLIIIFRRRSRQSIPKDFVIAISIYSDNHRTFDKPVNRFWEKRWKVVDLKQPWFQIGINEDVKSKKLKTVDYS